MAKNPTISAASRGKSFQSPNALINMILANPEEAKKAAYLGASFAPGTGEVISAKESVEDFSKGNIAMGTLGALGAVPLVGGAARFIRKGLRGADNIGRIKSVKAPEVKGFPKVSADSAIDYNSTKFKGDASFVHDSREANLQFTDFDKIPESVNEKRYLDNTYGDSGIYLDFSDGIFSGRTGVESPTYGYSGGENLYKVDVKFDNALVVTPDNGGLKKLEKIAGGTNSANVSKKLKDEGYDGLIVRGFNDETEKLERLADKKFGKLLDENAPGYINLPSYILRKQYDKFIKREDYIKELKRKKGSYNKLGITYDEVIALNPANAKAKLKGKKAFNPKTGKFDYKALD